MRNDGKLSGGREGSSWGLPQAAQQSDLVSYVQQDHARHLRERMEAPVTWAKANADVLGMLWERFETTGEWPQASELQRELFRAGRRFSAMEFGREMPGTLGHLDVSNGTIILTPRALLYAPAARPVLDRIAQLVRILVDRYATEGVPPEITSEEFEDLLGVDDRQTRQLAMLLMHDRFLFRAAGGRVEDNTQKFAADENSVIELPHVQSIEDYFGAQDRIWYSVPRGAEIPQELLDVPELQSGPEVTVQHSVAAEPRISHSTPEARAGLEGLHTTVTDACSELWANGHRREAILKASLAVRDVVRQLSGLEHLDGHSLMAEAFSPKEPRIVVADLRTATGRDVQQGTHFFAMGAMAALRNVHAHNVDEPNVDEARERLAIFSYIARRLDDAHTAPPEWAERPTSN